jgi:NADPH:quinone reductase
MRAFAVRSSGEAPAVHHLPIPSAESAFLIRVTHAGVNPVDFKLLDELTASSTYPFVLGVDFAGVVEHVPEGEREFHAGDRIFGMAYTHGSYAEYTTIAQDARHEPIARIPNGLSDEQAAALPVAALAALGSLELLGVSASERVVVMGATGGVGGYAVEMARARGVHVIATVRGDAEEAFRLGAEEVYDSKAEDVIAAIRASHPDGVDAILDLVSHSDAIHRDAEILKSGGRLVSTIYAADVAWFAERHVKAQNIGSRAMKSSMKITPNPLSSSAGLNEVSQMLLDGTITARIRSTVELEGAGQMLEKLRTGGLRGKAVLRLIG